MLRKTRSSIEVICPTPWRGYTISCPCLYLNFRPRALREFVLAVLLAAFASVEDLLLPLAEAVFAPEALFAALALPLVEAFFFVLESSDVVVLVREGFFEDLAIMGEIIQKKGNVVKGGGFGS